MRISDWSSDVRSSDLFERRVAKSFEELASRFPGKVLLTPGAKGALPSSFATSKAAIGSVENEPIFLALEGWGYAESEPSPSCPAPAANLAGRSEERRVGKEGVRTCRSRWSPDQ